jgi:hypothetical protein
MLPAALVLLLLLFLPAPVYAQVSPGPLSRAHKNLSGPTGCISCHAVKVGATEFRCMDCHKEITQRLAANRGYHATVVNNKTSSVECAKCHSEHNGENFQLIRWVPSQTAFDHAKTGWVLTGKHVGLDCAKCHNAQRVLAANASLIAIKDKNRTFLGLSSSCTSCHEDKHKGTLGPDCLRCHGTNDWQSAKEIDHSKTRFPLTGAHIHVACEKCHTVGTGPTAVRKWSGLAFGRCLDCHADPHRGAFQGKTCESCHTTASWKQVALEGKFDHSTTKYPLLGKHAQVGCLECHIKGDFKASVAFSQCADCHKPDPHNGQFASRADGGKCESCHTVEGFKPAKFFLVEHDLTAFPLRGKHAMVACAKCHIPQGRATRYKIKFDRCADCHEDAHQKQFAAAPHRNRCDDCHTELGFKPSTFTLARHQKLRFPLTGSHLAVACIDCHKAPQQEEAKYPRVPYHFEGLDCTTCHTDVHRGQFKLQMAKALTPAGVSKGCETCHSQKSWKDLIGFNHDNTGYPLTGAHRATPCTGCHRPPNMEVTLRDVDFRAAPRICEECHEDVHGAQFARAADHVTHCADCHTPMRWKPSLFDHEKTIFSLKGGHQNVSCAMCHKQFKEVEGKKVLFYKPTPTACAACHGAVLPSDKNS